MQGHKVPEGYRFLDLSDYGRPVAVWIARWALRRGWSPHAFTLLQGLAGLGAATLLATAQHPWLVLLLLPLKSTLDAVDGTLARLRGRPTRTGRFLDSNLDFLVNLALMLALVPGAGVPMPVALAAFVSMELQGSVYHHLYLLHRHRHGGDTSARPREDARAFPYENAAVVAALYRLYQVFYGWQDWLIQKLLYLRCAPAWTPSTRRLTLASGLGLGFQLLLIGLMAAAGLARGIPWLFLGPGNLWALALVLSCR